MLDTAKEEEVLINRIKMVTKDRVDMVNMIILVINK
jgi:hypothetical protein